MQSVVLNYSDEIEFFFFLSSDDSLGLNDLIFILDPTHNFNFVKIKPNEMIG